MVDAEETTRRKGHYFGTEINEKWWKRYRKDKMFARGTGEYWYDTDALFFRRYLTDDPMIIRFGDVKEIKTGKWHAGQWAGGRQIIKMIWRKEGLTLSSGFLLSRSRSETERIKRELTDNINKAASGPM